MIQFPVRSVGRIGLILLAVVAPPAGAMERVLFAHNPALSPDGRRLAFDWKGDVWVVPIEGGLAFAVTSHPELDGNPCFSPDGERLAWTSNRAGNFEVYLGDSYGAEPRRLTFHPWSDGASGFTPDGQAVIFASTRYLPAWDGGGSRFLYPNRQEFLVPIGGGTPTRLLQGLGSNGRLSPDGTKMVFVRGGVGSYRRGYRGSANDDLWLHDRSTGSYTQLTDFAGVDTDPVWSPDGQAIYFVSDRDGIRNLWKLPLDGEPTQLTHHATPVHSPTVARQLPRVVYECDDQLYKLDLDGGEPEPIAIAAPADDAQRDVLWQTLDAGCGEFAVAPSGKEVAFIVRGDIYVTRFPAGGFTRQLTDTPAVEGGLTWTSDSQTLWFHSDRGGQYDLFRLSSGDPKEPRLRHTTTLETVNLSNSTVDETSPQISPDGKQVVFVRDKGDIVVAGLDLTQETVVSRHWSYPLLDWAPTSDWLAFSRVDEEFNNDVFIVPAGGGEATNVSQHPKSDYRPVWSGDGSKLAFQSQRSGDQSDVYYVWLRIEDWERTKADRDFAEDLAFDKPKDEPKKDEPKKDEDEPKAAGEPTKDEPKKDEPKTTAIDLKGIHERLIRLTRTVDSESWLSASPDGKSFAYTLDGSVYSIGWEKPEPKQLASGVGASRLGFSRDGKRIDFLRTGGRIATVGSGGGATTTTDFAADVRRDLLAERLYLFDTVWRIMRDEFYDPALHGVDWPAARDRHRRRVQAAPTERDFEGVVESLLGELNSSHVGYSRSYPAPRSEPAAGDLGIVWSDERPERGLVVEAVVEGSPASKAASRIVAGETVLAVDGVELGPKVNVWDPLRGKIGALVKLRVADAAGLEREVVIRPADMGEIGQRRYEAFVAGQRKRTTELSDGRVGYAHIRSMDQGSLDDFERDLFAAAHGKQVLIIDVRWNGGGWTADHLLGMLMVQQHAYTVPRGGDRGYPSDRRMAPAWTGPTVLLANATSISNAEILAHAFKTLGRGPVVGETTFGGVISTGGTTLVDGSSLRLPARGWYRITDGQNMENQGAVPDIAVPIGPADEAAGVDPQLEAAVKAAMELVQDTGNRARDTGTANGGR